MSAQKQQRMYWWNVKVWDLSMKRFYRRIIMNQMTRMNQKMNMNHVLNVYQMMRMSQITNMNWMKNMKECNVQYEHESQPPRVKVLIFLQQQAKPCHNWLYWINWT